MILLLIFCRSQWKNVDILASLSFDHYHFLLALRNGNPISPVKTTLRQKTRQMDKELEDKWFE